MKRSHLIQPEPYLKIRVIRVIRVIKLVPGHVIYRSPTWVLLIPKIKHVEKNTLQYVLCPQTCSTWAFRQISTKFPHVSQWGSIKFEKNKNLFGPKDPPWWECHFSLWVAIGAGTSCGERGPGPQKSRNGALSVHSKSSLPKHIQCWTPCVKYHASLCCWIFSSDNRGTWPNFNKNGCHFFSGCVVWAVKKSLTIFTAFPSKLFNGPQPS